MSTNTLQPCPRCEGTGKAEISDELEMFLQQLSCGPCFIYELAQTFDIKPQAALKRLETLMRLNFVHRTRKGRCHLYSLTPRKTRKAK